jgi:hypothetical protein
MSTLLVETMVFIDETGYQLLSGSEELCITRAIDCDLAIGDLVAVINSEDMSLQVARVISFERSRETPAKATFKVVC